MIGEQLVVPLAAVPAAVGQQHEVAAAAEQQAETPAISALPALLSGADLQTVFDLLLGYNGADPPTVSSGPALQKTLHQDAADLEKLRSLSPTCEKVFGGEGPAVELVCDILGIDAALARSEAKRCAYSSVWSVVRRLSAVLSLGLCSCAPVECAAGGAVPAAEVVPGSKADEGRIRYFYLASQQGVCSHCVGDDRNKLVSAKAAHRAGCSDKKVLKKLPSITVKRRDLQSFGIYPVKPHECATVYLAAHVRAEMQEQQRPIKAGGVAESMVSREQLAVDPADPSGSRELLETLSLGETRKVQLLTYAFEFEVVSWATAMEKRATKKCTRKDVARSQRTAAVRKKRAPNKKWSCSACGKKWARYSRHDPPHKKGSKRCSKTVGEGTV